MGKNRQIRFLRNRILKKVVNIMKLTFILLFVSFMQVSASLYSQDARVSIQVKETLIEDVFQLIEQQTNYVFVYNHEQVSKVGKISAEFKDQCVAEVLDICLKGSGLRYELLENTIIIRQAGERVQSDKELKGRVIKGVVTDTKKGPIPGVTVLVKGTTLGVVTDVSGKYRLTLPKEQKDISLIFSFVGMKTQVIKLGEQDTLNVVLEEDIADLDEVVVRAYGTQNKREMISAISSVKAEDMKELPAASIASMLQGRLAGVNIIQQSGAPGSASVIAVRGFNSLLVDGASDGQPLWVVDGVPMHSFVSPVTGTNTLADLDPSMIESVEVLKDAAAASIYGSRAGNGVILVTTKKGKEGKAVFSANVSYTLAQLMEYPVQTGGRMERWLDLLMARNYRGNISDYSDFDVYKQHYPTSYEDVWNTNGAYDSFWGSGRESDVYLNYKLQDSLDPYYNSETNWYKYAFRTGKVLNANIQASGGSDKFQYMVGIGYYDEKGIMVNSGYSRANLISNLTAQLTKKINLDTRIYLSYVDRTMNKAVKNVMDKSRYEKMSVDPKSQPTYIAGTKSWKRKCYNVYMIYEIGRMTIVPWLVFLEDMKY